MSATHVEPLTAVVECSRIDFGKGDQVVCQQKNRPTDIPYIQNYAGRVEEVVMDGGSRAVAFFVRQCDATEYEVPICFTIVDELPEDWKYRILRKRI